MVLKEIYSDYCRAYEGFANYEALANYKMKHHKNKFANNHIKGIKNFWDMLNIDYLNLMDNRIFLIHLEECKFKYNTKTKQKLILKTVEVDK